MNEYSTNESARPARAPVVTFLVAGAMALFASCSTPGEPTFSGDPIEGDLPSSTIFGAADNVADASENGIELDNGNVPGSQNDQDLDEYTDDIDIDAIADDPYVDQPELFEE